MKIQEVHIKSFKVLKDFDAYPEGKNIMIMGDNGLGKSTFIQAIKIALGSKDVPPIEKGEWEVDVTDAEGNPVKFKAQVKNGKPKVTIEMANGMKDSRVGTLKSIVGDVSFDVSGFVEMSKTEAGRKRQIQMFKSMFPEDVVKALEDHEANIKAQYDERTELNREIKYLKTDIEKHPMHGVKKAPQKVDITAVMERFEEANKHNAVYDRAQDTLESVKNEEILIDSRIKQLKGQLAFAEAEKLTLKERREKGEKWLRDNEKIDVSGLRSDLEHAGEKNKEYEKYEEYIAKKGSLEAKEDEAEAMTVKIESIRAEIDRFIREDMDSPVPGLRFEGDQLVYNDYPVHPESLSTSEIIELGIKMTMASNPNLGVLFIEHGESIGKKRMSEILKIAKNNDWQVIMEQVDRGNETLTVEIINDSLTKTEDI